MKSLLLATLVALPFTDVSERYEPFVTPLYEEGVTQGVSETQYGINQTITRGDAAVLLHRALAPEIIRPDHVYYTDVPLRQRVAINSLYERNYINDPLPTFRPQEKASREFIARVILNIKVGNDASIDRIRDIGVMLGDSKGNLWLGDAVTRGELAIIIQKARDLEKAREDNANYKYFYVE